MTAKTRKQLQEENEALKHQNDLLKQLLEESQLFREMRRAVIETESSMSRWIV